MDRFSDLSETHSLVKTVVGLAMKVHRTLGPGFLEVIYANALVIELKQNQIDFLREHRISVIYEGVIVGDYIADLVLDKQLVVELKAVEVLSPHHSLQLVNYLTATHFDEGLLLNFGAKSLEFRTKTRHYLSSAEDIKVSTAAIPQFSNSVNSV